MRERSHLFSFEAFEEAWREKVLRLEFGLIPGVYAGVWRGDGVLHGEERLDVLHLEWQGNNIIMWHVWVEFTRWLLETHTKAFHCINTKNPMNHYVLTKVT